MIWDFEKKRKETQFLNQVKKLCRIRDGNTHWDLGLWGFRRPRYCLDQRKSDLLKFQWFLNSLAFPFIRGEMKSKLEYKDF